MEDKRLQDIVDERFTIPIKEANLEVIKNQDKILSLLLNEVLDTNNKEKMLLNFRRGLEMLIRLPFFVTVISKSTNHIIAVREDNLLQLLDDRYYSEIQLSSFLDIFKIETNDFKQIMSNLLPIAEPHIKLVINYILTHYNTTFRKFMNRNSEYYYMYKFFFDNGEDMKYVLDCLNSYHYTESNNKNLSINIEDIQQRILKVYNNLVPLFKKICKKIST